MWLAVPITNLSPGNFYRDLNELLAKKYMPKLNILDHMPPELNPNRSTVAPSAHTSSSNLFFFGDICWNQTLKLDY